MATKNLKNNNIIFTNTNADAYSNHSTGFRIKSKMTGMESGRSMVEMLGVLAIVGVLSIGGIMGYSYAMDKYRANETVNDLNIIYMNHLNELQSLTDAEDLTEYGGVISEENAKTSMGYEYEVVSYGYTASIILYDVPVSVFEQLEEIKFQGIEPYCFEPVDNICTEIRYPMLSDGSACYRKNMQPKKGICACTDMGTRYFGPKCDQICDSRGGVTIISYKEPFGTKCHCKNMHHDVLGNRHCLVECGEHGTRNDGKNTCICDEGWRGTLCNIQVTP